MLALAITLAAPMPAMSNGAAAAFAGNENQRLSAQRAAQAAADSSTVHMLMENPKFGYSSYDLVDGQIVRPYIGAKWDDISFGKASRLPMRRMVVIGPDAQVPYFEACQLLIRGEYLVCDSADGKAISLTQLIQQTPSRRNAKLLGVGVNLHNRSVLINYVLP